jgi:hypothetical protein
LLHEIISSSVSSAIKTGVSEWADEIGGKLNAMKNYARCPDCEGEGFKMLDCVVKW